MLFAIFISFSEHFEKCKNPWTFINWFLLTVSWQRSLTYSNQPTDLLCISMDWFLYDRILHHERVKCGRMLKSLILRKICQYKGFLWPYFPL